jgi:tetratricopeptide (TPR) repeat protein
MALSNDTRIPGKYKAFISYSHVDSRWARKIQSFLESYRVPSRLEGTASDGRAVPRRLAPVFLDRDELASVSSLSKVVNQALESSDNLVVICSPNSATSRWVNEEVLAFKRLGRAERVFCFIVDGEPYASELPGREHEECFCEALRYQVRPHGELSDSRAEPVAADARKGRDGYSLARIKLIAGLIGVGVDDLRQREMRRRYRRMAYVMVAAVFGMAITLALAVSAISARNDAERRREQADDLIGFMLGDLRERLNEVGRLDVLDSVADKAMQYFSALPAQDLDEGALARRAEALMQLGQVSMSRGELSIAAQLFGEALGALQDLNARDPSDLDVLFGLGQAHFWVGYVHWERDDLLAADESMRQYYDISARLYEAQPFNDDYGLELGYALNNLAVLSNKRGDSQAALDYNERVITLIGDIHERNAGDDKFRRALAEAYTWRGSMLRNDLQLRAAEARLLDYLNIVREALMDHPDDTQWLNHQMLASRFVGDIALDLGKVEEAEARYRDGFSTAARLTSIEPANDRWQLDKAVIMRKLAEAALRRGALDEAFTAIEELRALVDERLVIDAAGPDWQFLDSELDLVLAEALRLSGRRDDFEDMVADVSESLGRLVEANPLDQPGRLALAKSLLLQGRSEDALTVLEHDSLELDNPDARSVWLRAGLRTGKDGLSRELTELVDSGYRHPDFLADLAQLGIAYGSMESESR